MNDAVALPAWLPLALGLGGVLLVPLLNRAIALAVAAELAVAGARPAGARCGRCGRALPWGAELPGLHLLWPRTLWRGARRPCGHPAEPWRVLVALAATVGLAAAAWALRGVTPAVLVQALVLGLALLVLATVDGLARIVERRVLAAALVFRVAALLAFERDATLEMLGGLLVGTGLLTLLAFCYETLRRRQGLGEGDPLVLGLIGAHVGWRGVLPALTLAALLGLAGGLLWLLWRRRPLDSVVPFVPALAAAGYLVHLAQLTGWSEWAWRLLGR
ncbi:MAG: prepilin peptidase [Candidatus Lambdaproteobacteria bacterium]|nr:prepilin peptidase [Candidatus Lambdaproteobacteria bacterium]